MPPLVKDVNKSHAIKKRDISKSWKPTNEGIIEAKFWIKNSRGNGQKTYLDSLL